MKGAYTRMETNENIAQETTRKQPLMKRIFRGRNHFLGTFLFTIFMSQNLLASLGVDTHVRTPLPYFVIFSCFVCVTIGASYWFGNNARRWRSFCISSVITFVLYSFHLWSLTYSNYCPTILQSLVILSLPIVSTVYSILKLRKAKKINLETSVSNTTHQSSRRSIALAKTVRLIALISFCSVFLETAQHVLVLLFQPYARMRGMYPFDEAIDAIIAAYALWLVICFARKEFVQLSEHAEGAEENIKIDA
jgi:hypothetical protein